MASFNAIERANEYIAWDPNGETRQAVATMREQQDIAQLQSILGSRLQFGTAGLRGPMGAGYNRMNELVVLQTTQGLIRYIDSLDPSAKDKGVIIGYDHRQAGQLSSEGFARISAAVFLSQGYKTHLLSGIVPTPFVAFGVQHFGCAAGIMVTASHNPKQDNGFKVYWNTGSQIVPPHDTGIAEHILQNLQPWQAYDTTPVGIEQQPQFIKDVKTTIANAYFGAIATLSEGATNNLNAASNIKAVYTAMHGVGGEFVKRAFQESFRHCPLNAVPVQMQPDPTFPTVKFPNPEEKGALDAAMAYASEQKATLILANDPDADRLAVAEFEATAGINKWYVFSGNELGVLLGYWQLLRWKKQSPSTPAALLASIVSSRMLKNICQAESMLYFDTLTGFKWLGDKAIGLRAAGTPVIFMYEEALGYCVGDVLCDKDGISAASLFLEMASTLQREQGLTVKQHLQQLYLKYGEFVSYNSYVISHDKSVTAQIFVRLRTGGTAAGSGDGYWSECAGSKITTIKDITKGYDSSTPDHKSLLPITPDSEMIMFEFDNGCSVTLRTSGTEPKIKFYTEIAGKPGQARAEVEQTLHSFVDNLVNEMLQPDVHGLARA